MLASPFPLPPPFAACFRQQTCPPANRTSMETDSKEAGKGDMGKIPPTAAAATPREEDMKETAEISAATAQTGQLQHEKRGFGHQRTPLTLPLSCLLRVCACGDVGAPLVSLCPEQRRDSAGKPACEICGRRLSTCKGKLHTHPQGKICTPCYKIPDGHRVTSISVSSPPTSRSHKRSSSLSPSPSTLLPAHSRHPLLSAPFPLFLVWRLALLLLLLLLLCLSFLCALAALSLPLLLLLCLLLLPGRCSEEQSSPHAGGAGPTRAGGGQRRGREEEEADAVGGVNKAADSGLPATGGGAAGNQSGGTAEAGLQRRRWSPASTPSTPSVTSTMENSPATQQRGSAALSFTLDSVPLSLPSPLFLSLLLAPSHPLNYTAKHHFGLKPVQISSVHMI